MKGFDRLTKTLNGRLPNKIWTEGNVEYLEYNRVIIGCMGDKIILKKRR